MKENDAGLVVLGCMGASVAVVVVIVVGVLVEGYVIRALWGWHVSPVLNVPAPPLAICVGLAALASALQNPPQSCDCKEKVEKTAAQSWMSVASLLFLRPALLLFIGWMAHASL